MLITVKGYHSQRIRNRESDAEQKIGRKKEGALDLKKNLFCMHFSLYIFTVFYTKVYTYVVQGPNFHFFFYSTDKNFVYIRFLDEIVCMYISIPPFIYFVYSQFLDEIVCISVFPPLYN